MQMIIGGKHVDASNGKTSQVVNPATGQVIDTVPEVTLEDLDRAIGLAVEGQKEWNAIPLHQRLAILETYCQLLTREETVEKIARVMCEQGGKLLCGGKRSGAFVEPTVIEVTPEMDIARDMEVFGPVWPVIPFDTLEEALEIANNTIFGLSSGVITSNMRTAMKVANGIQAGACVINGTGNYRLAHQPFGGYKYSGVGREGAVSTLEEMTQQKMISFKGILN